MPRLPFITQSARDSDHEQANTGRLINWYLEPIVQGGKSNYSLKSVLGMESFATMGGAATPTLFVRDIKGIAGRLYVLAGGTLYDVREDASQNVLTTVDNAEGSQIFGADPGNIVILANNTYNVWDGSALTQPTGGAFSSFGSGAFVGNYVVLSEDDGRRFLWSDLADAKTLSALNFATAEAQDDKILRVMENGGHLWVMKERSIEVWAVTGQAGANAFQRLSGAVYEIGLKARDLVTEYSGGLFFIGSDGIAYLASGQTMQPVSTPPVETDIEQGAPTNCLFYEDEGHKFCNLRFSDRPAWAYDFSTGMWHERASGADDPWAATVSGNAFGKWYVGDANGNVSRLGRVNLDNGSPLIRTAVTNELYREGERFRIPLLELTGRVGQGGVNTQVEEVRIHYPDGRIFYNGDDDLTIPDDAVWNVDTGYAAEPRIMISLSDNGGRTFGPEITRDLGEQGEYGQLVRLRNLGQFRRLCARFRISSESDISLDGSVNVKVA